MIQYSHCPVCGHNKIHSVLSAVDYTVSKESFDIGECKSCTARFTQGVPEQNLIAKYYQSAEYVSHSETKSGVVNKLYHFIRAITLTSKRKLILKETGLKKGNMLDLGCGTGAFLNEMKQAGWSNTGIEPDELARKNALDLYGVNALTPERFFSLQESSFDAITMWHVLEHVHQLHEYIVQLKKILKPGGVLFIAVPNYTSYDAKKYGPYWAAYDVPRHLYHFSPKSMQILMQQHHLSIKKTIPMWFDSVYVSMLSEKYKGGNILSAFFTGLLSNMVTISQKERCSSLIYVIKKDFQ